MSPALAACQLIWLLYDWKMKIALEYENNALAAERAAQAAVTDKERLSYLSIAEVWREFAAKRREMAMQALSSAD